jgi:hypothetical protein
VAGLAVASFPTMDCRNQGKKRAMQNAKKSIFFLFLIKSSAA